jgi:hypothetical protein
MYGRQEYRIYNSLDSLIIALKEIVASIVETQASEDKL